MRSAERASARSMDAGTGNTAREKLDDKKLKLSVHCFNHDHVSASVSRA